ncbi:hypothetical protein NUSPORA_01180 [Nucleospora cyclopteri]
MPFLYSDRLFSAPVEEISMNNDFLVTKYHNLIRIYDLELNFIREKYFYSKIYDMKFTNDQIIVLLGDKLIQCDVSFNLLAMRSLKDTFNQLFAHKDLCVVRNPSKIKYFRLKGKFIREEFITSDKIDLVPSNISIIAAVKNNVLKLINIDGKATVIGEFSLLDNFVEVKCIGKFVVVVYKFMIEIIYKSSRFALKFNEYVPETNQEVKYKLEKTNKNSYEKIEKEKLLGENSPEKETVYKKVKYEEIGPVFYNCKVFSDENEIYLVNGNKKLYKIDVHAEINKIYDVKIHFLGESTIPSCAFGNEKGYAIGSVNSFSLIKIGDKTAKIRNLGKITAINRKKAIFIISTENFVFHLQRTIHMDCIKSTFIQATDLVAVEKEIFVVNNTKAIKLNLDALKVDEQKHEIDITKLGPSNFSEDQDGEYKITCKDDLQIFHGSELLFKAGISDLKKFVFQNDLQHGIKIDEIYAKKTNKLLFLFVKTNKLLYIYSYINSCLEKQFVPECITFNASEGRAMYKNSDFVYVKSQIPFFIFFATKLVFVEADRAYDAVVQTPEALYTLYNQILSKCKFNTNKLKNFGSNGFINKLSQPLFQNAEFEIEEKTFPDKIAEESEKVFLYQDLCSDLKIWGFEVCSFFAVASALKAENYKFVPFVPLVHRTTDEAQTITERIFPKEENTKPAILGRTFRNFLVLFSNKFQYICNVQLGKNEFITDFKVVLNKFIIAGISLIDSEDKVCKGKILLYSISSIVADPTAPHKNIKLKFICQEQTKYSVNKLDIFYKETGDKKEYELSDILLFAGIGTRLMVYEVGFTEFTAVGRLEISVSTAFLHIIKNFIILGDVFRGLFFYFIRPENPLKLTLLGQTFSINDLKGVFSIVDCSTKNNNVFLFSINKLGVIQGFIYSPDHEKSFRGTRLIKKVDISTKTESYPVIYSGLTTNLIAFNNLLVNIKHVNVKEHFHELYLTICDTIEDSFGLFPESYLESDCLLGKDVEFTYCKQVLLEYTNMSIKDQKKIQDKTGQKHEEILECILEIIINENKQ